MQNFNKTQLKIIRDQQEDSKERAKNAMTVDETWEGMKNTLKSLFLPGFESVATAVSKSMGDFTQYPQQNGFIDKLVCFSRDFAS